MPKLGLLKLSPGLAKAAKVVEWWQPTSRVAIEMQTADCGELEGNAHGPLGTKRLKRP